MACTLRSSHGGGRQARWRDQAAEGEVGGAEQGAGGAERGGADRDGADGRLQRRARTGRTPPENPPPITTRWASNSTTTGARNVPSRVP